LRSSLLLQDLFTLPLHSRIFRPILMLTPHGIQSVLYPTHDAPGTGACSQGGLAAWQSSSPVVGEGIHKLTDLFNPLDGPLEV
jgi:hypothetical protein